MIYQINMFICFQRKNGHALIKINHDANISLDFNKEKTYYFDFRNKQGIIHKKYLDKKKK